jgi:hypothetical protein
MSVFLNVCKYLCIHIYTCIYMYKYAHINQSMYIYMYVHNFMKGLSRSPEIFWRGDTMYVYYDMYVYTSIYIYVQLFSILTIFVNDRGENHIEMTSKDHLWAINAILNTPKANSKTNTKNIRNKSENKIVDTSYISLLRPCEGSLDTSKVTTIYIYVYIFIHIYMYIYVYICMYIYIYI